MCILKTKLITFVCEAISSATIVQTCFSVVSLKLNNKKALKKKERIKNKEK